MLKAQMISRTGLRYCACSPLASGLLPLKGKETLNIILPLRFFVILACNFTSYSTTTRSKALCKGEGTPGPEVGRLYSQSCLSIVLSSLYSTVFSIFLLYFFFASEAFQPNYCVHHFSLTVCSIYSTDAVRGQNPTTAAWIGSTRGCTHTRLKQ